jgi:hypothetical protein
LRSDLIIKKVTVFARSKRRLCSCRGKVVAYELGDWLQSGAEAEAAQSRTFTWNLMMRATINNLNKSS